ncbi:hypothetical protein [Wolbachia pipientis]|uniref:hypothetical protein n=1 Tax=Wolbachia pipientis TaxID=955 RepID=UPI003364D5BE
MNVIKILLKKEDAPLQLAVKNNHTELVELLVVNAKVDIVDGTKIIFYTMLTLIVVEQQY